jgi:hypothetical protein
MTSRTELHRATAEAALRAHQALTEAHVAGHEPEAEPIPDDAPSFTIYTPQLGEQQMQGTPMSGDERSLKELQMYWKRIPDFGVKRYEIFPSETGWAQILYWSGTGEDGVRYEAEESDIVRTDDDGNIARFEIYSDAGQCMRLVAYANDRTVEEMEARRASTYEQLLARQ